jgi:RHH-type transcriptional regulator, rel operon repressor / antitoxin RelB
MKKAITIRLDESLLNELDIYAQEMGISISDIIEKALENYFDTLDETENYKIKES